MLPKLTKNEEERVEEARARAEAEARARARAQELPPFVFEINGGPEYMTSTETGFEIGPGAKLIKAARSVLTNMVGVQHLINVHISRSGKLVVTTAKNFNIDSFIRSMENKGFEITYEKDSRY